MPHEVEYAPFLLLSIRAEDDAADDEHRSFLRFGGLESAELTRIGLTATELGRIDLADWSGVMLGGGPYNVTDPPDEKSATQVRVEAELLPLIERIVDADFPFLGCCYGIGTLGSVIGATVDRTHTEPVGAVTVRLTSAAHADPLFAGLPDSFDAYGGHKEAARILPPGVIDLAASDTCPIQAFRVRDNVYATQFHPELDADGMCTRIDAYKNHGYFAPDTAEALKVSARERDISHPSTILRRFVERYRRAR